MRRLRWACLLTAIIPATLAGQASDPFDALRKAMALMVDGVRAPSVAVAVAQGGRIVFEDAVGWANRERAIRATPNTMYALASVTKPMTATGVMVLVQRGHVRLDHPIDDYLGSAKLTALAGDAKSASVRRVLSHTAGLPVHSQFFYADRGLSPPPMEETIRRYGKIMFPPGTLSEYSNLGFGILGYAIERVSGVPFAQFMKTEVFVPLGLTRTSIGVPCGDADSIAVLYGYDDRPLPCFTFDHIGASSAFSSAHDLVRFAMFHLKDLSGQASVLSESAIDEMHKVVSPASSGLGFAVLDSGRRVAHTGGMPGATILMVLFPRLDVAVVVLSNASTRTATFRQEFAISRAALTAVLPAAQVPSMTAPGPADNGSLAGRALPVGEWVGSLRTYEGVVPIRMRIGADSATAAIGAQPEVPIRNAVFNEGLFSGTFAASMPTEDAGRWPHTLSFLLLLRDGKLAGEVTANSATDRVYFNISAYAELALRGSVKGRTSSERRQRSAGTR